MWVFPTVVYPHCPHSSSQACGPVRQVYLHKADTHPGTGQQLHTITDRSGQNTPVIFVGRLSAMLGRHALSNTRGIHRKKDVRITFFSLPDRGRFKYHGTSWQLLPPVPAGGKGGAGDCSRSSSWCGGAAVCYCLPLSTGCMQLQSWQLTENKRGGGRGGEEVNKKETLLPYPRCSCNA